MVFVSTPASASAYNLQDHTNGTIYSDRKIINRTTEYISDITNCYIIDDLWSETATWSSDSNVTNYDSNITNYDSCTTDYSSSIQTVTITGGYLSRWQGRTRAIEPPADRLRKMIQARQAPIFINTRSPLSQQIDDRERRARDTLKRLVGESQYRRFLTHGFITARGKSGKIYQIKPGQGMTNVYSPTGQPIERLCVILRGKFPRTDELITRFLMILNDEDNFRSLANVLRYHKPLSATKNQLDQRSLPDIFKMLKGQAA